MTRFATAIATGLVVLAMVLAPAAQAADEPQPRVLPTPPTPTAVAGPTATPFDGNGEIVIDPTFIIETATPAGDVEGLTGRPDVTPPPTDTITATTTPGTGLQVLLVLGVVGSLLALLAARSPVARGR